MRIWGVLLVAIVLSSAVYAQDGLQVKEGIGSVYTASYEKGVEDIRGIAERSEIEEQWVYSDNIWYDIGYDQDSVSVGIDFSKARDNLIGKTSIMVHNHPYANDGKFYPPSGPDLEQYAKYKSEFNSYSNTELKAQVVDKDGIWSYDLSEETQTLLSGRNFENGKVNRKRVDLKNKLISLEGNFITLDGRTLNEAANEYISEASKLGVYLAYTSFIQQDPFTFSPEINALTEPDAIPQFISCLSSEESKYKCESQNPFTLIRCSNGLWTSTNNEFSSRYLCSQECQKYQSNCLEEQQFNYIIYSGVNSFSKDVENQIASILNQIDKEKGIRIVLEISNVQKNNAELENDFKTLGLDVGPNRIYNTLIFYNILNLKGSSIHSSSCSQKMSDIINRPEIINELKNDPNPHDFPNEFKNRAFLSLAKAISAEIGDYCKTSSDFANDYFKAKKSGSIEPIDFEQKLLPKYKKLSNSISKDLSISKEISNGYKNKLERNVRNQIFASILDQEIKLLNEKIKFVKNRGDTVNLEKEKRGLNAIYSCMSKFMLLSDINKTPEECAKKLSSEIKLTGPNTIDDINYALKNNDFIKKMIETPSQNIVNLKPGTNETKNQNKKFADEISIIDKKIKESGNYESYNILQISENKLDSSVLEKEKSGVESIKKCLLNDINISTIQANPKSCVSKTDLLSVDGVLNAVGLSSDSSDKIDYALKNNIAVLYLLEIDKTESIDSCKSYFNVAHDLEIRKETAKSISAYLISAQYCRRYNELDLANRAESASMALDKGTFSEGVWEASKYLTSPVNIAIAGSAMLIGPLAGTASLSAAAVSEIKLGVSAYFSYTLTSGTAQSLGDYSVSKDPKKLGEAAANSLLLLSILNHNNPSKIKEIFSSKNIKETALSIREETDTQIEQSRSQGKDPQVTELENFLSGDAPETAAEGIVKGDIKSSEIETKSAAKEADIDKPVPDNVLTNEERNLQTNIGKEIDKADVIPKQEIEVPIGKALGDPSVKLVLTTEGGTIKATIEDPSGTYKFENRDGTQTTTKTYDSTDLKTTSLRALNDFAPIKYADGTFADSPNAQKINYYIPDRISFQGVPEDKVTEIFDKLKIEGLTPPVEYFPNREGKILIKPQNRLMPEDLTTASGGMYRVTESRQYEIVSDENGIEQPIYTGNTNLLFRYFDNQRVENFDEAPMNTALKIAYDVLKDDITSGNVRIVDSSVTDLDRKYVVEDMVKENTAVSFDSANSVSKQIEISGKDIIQLPNNLGTVNIDIENDAGLVPFLSKIGQSDLSTQNSILNSIISIVKKEVPYQEETAKIGITNSQYLSKFCVSAGGSGGDCTIQGMYAATSVKYLINNGILRGRVFYEQRIGHAWARFVSDVGEEIVVDPAYKNSVARPSDLYGLDHSGEYFNPIKNVNENAKFEFSLSYDGKSVMPDRVVFTSEDGSLSAISFKYDSNRNMIEARAVKDDANGNTIDVTNSINVVSVYNYLLDRINGDIRREYGGQ